MTKPEADALKKMAGRMRLAALDMALGAGRHGAHLGPALSCMEIMATLYGRLLRLDPKNPAWPERDRLLVSKAHCVLALYTALSEAGFLKPEELAGFEKSGSDLAGHPTWAPAQGLEYAGGSLGQALGVGLGRALAAKGRGQGHRIFVLLGDGELNEGSNWEAFMAAAHFRLDNLTAVIDKNQLQYDGSTEEVMALGDLGAKLRAFGWETREADGHEPGELIEALEPPPSADRPLAVIAKTIKGKGVSFMENVREWHHAVLSPAQHEQAAREVREAAGL